MIRGVARITISRGRGRGAVLGIVRLRRSAESEDALRAGLFDALNPQAFDGVISTHLIENDPRLSKPLTDKPSDSTPGAGDWFVLIDATEIIPVQAVLTALTGNTTFKPALISSGSYRLLWDISKDEIPA